MRREALEVLSSLERRKGEDVDEWAARMAKEAAKATD
jgi:hypothetical protein